MTTEFVFVYTVVVVVVAIVIAAYGIPLEYRR